MAEDYTLPITYYPADTMDEGAPNPLEQIELRNPNSQLVKLIPDDILKRYDKTREILENLTNSELLTFLNTIIPPRHMFNELNDIWLQLMGHRDRLSREVES